MTHKRAKFLFDVETEIKKRGAVITAPLIVQLYIYGRDNGLREQLRTIPTISFRSIQSIVCQL